MYIFIFITLMVSISVGMATIPRIVLISKKKRLFDKIDQRKVHTIPTSRLGGIAFLPTMLIAFCFAIGLRYLFGYDIFIVYETPFIIEFMFFLVGAFTLFFVGLTDDLIEISYKQKFLAQIAAAVMVVISNVYFKNFEGLLGIHNLPVVVGAIGTVLFIVFVINAFNLIDGVDGLCTLLSSLALFVTGLLFFLDQVYVYAMLAFSLLGVLIVFYYYNTLSKKMKIFMGDSGSLILGYVISFLLIKFCNLNDTGMVPYHIDNAIMIVAGIVWVPLFDTMRVFAVRIARRKSPFYPDKNHIHHKFLQMGYSHRQTAVSLLLLALSYTILNFLLSEKGMNINLQLAVNLALGVVINLLLNRNIGKLKSKQ